MNLAELLTKLRQKNVLITQQAFTITIELAPQALTTELLDLLRSLFHNYTPTFFVILKNLPPCLFPNYHNQIVYKQQNTLHYKRIPACRTCHLKSKCPGWCCDLSLKPDQIKPIKNVPSEIVLEITGQCNLNCGYCTSATKSTRHAPLKTIKAILNDAKRYHIPAIRFTGGEPLLHPQFAQIASYAKANGFYVLLNTNATLVTPELLKTFSRSIDNVLVSLQEFNSESSQLLTRTSGLFQKKIQNIFLLRTYVPTLRIGTVITPTLLNHWPRYVALIKRIRPSSWELFRPMNSSANQDAPITREVYLKLAKNLLQIKQSGITAKLANALPLCILQDMNLATSTMLGAQSDDGNSRLVWDVRGFFKPSYFIEKNLGKDIKTAWNHPFLIKTRKSNYLPGTCQTCPYLSWCRGGSRAMAFKAYHNYFAPDPLFDQETTRLTIS